MITAQLALLLAVWGTTPTSSAQALVEPSVREALAASMSHEAYVLVVFDRDGLGQGETRTASIEARRATILSTLSEADFRPVYQWRNVAGMSGYATEHGLELLAKHPFVQRIGSDMQGSGQLGTSVPFIGASAAHANGVTGDGVTIAVIDTGIDTDHPDLMDDIAPGGMRFLLQGVNVGPTFEDVIGHGTAVAGTITSGGVVAGVGVAPDAKILPIQVVDSIGQSFLSDWVAAVDYVVSAAPTQTGLAAINMSLATVINFSECPCDSAAAVNMLLGDAIRTARDQNILTFASSGNRGECNAMGSPACLEAAIAVAAVYVGDSGREPIVATYQNFFGTSFDDCFDATTGADQIACFSNRSACNELAAPGRSIRSSVLGGGTGDWTGTSQASPHVAGALALLVEGTGADVESCLTALKLTGQTTVDACGTNPTPIRVDVAAALATGKPFLSYCFGNGGDQMGCTDCPCGNNAGSEQRGGCLNSIGTSAQLRAKGLPRVSNDSLRFEVRDLPASAAAVLISGANRLPASSAHPCFSLASGIPTQGDGLRCAGGSFKRHGLRSADSNGSIGRTNRGWGGEDAPPSGLIEQGGFAAGQTRHFQAIYRDFMHGTCTTGLASTQAVSTVLVP